jgi:hypothetical protein
MLRVVRFHTRLNGALFSMRFGCSIALALAVVASGCSENGAARVAQLNKSNIQKVSNLYSLYYQLKSSSGPKDAAALKEFAASNSIPTDRLEMMQIDPKNLDALFVSERDGKPFKIKPNVPMNPMVAASAVVFEDTGIDGQRQVGFTNSSVQEADNAKYTELWGGKNSSEPKPNGSEAAKVGG